MSSGSKDEKAKKNGRKRTNRRANQPRSSTSPPSSRNLPEDAESKEAQESEQTQPLDLRTIQRVPPRSSSTSSIQLIPPPPPPTPTTPCRRPTPAPAVTQELLKFCDWCKGITTSPRSGNSSFCKDTCFESYRRCHYKRRNCCAICGQRGDWEVIKPGSVAHKLEDLPERACSACTKLRNSKAKMDPQEGGNMMPPSTTSPVSSSATVTPTGRVGPSTTISASTPFSSTGITMQRTQSVIQSAPIPGYQTMRQMQNVSGLRANFQHSYPYQHPLGRLGASSVQNFPTPRTHNAAISHASSFRMSSPGFYHSPSSHGGSARMPPQVLQHSPPTLNATMRMPTQTFQHSPPVLSGRRIPTQLVHHSPQAFSGGIRTPTPESRQIGHPPNVSTPVQLILNVTSVSSPNVQSSNSWLHCDQLDMDPVTGHQSSMPSPRPNCATPSPGGSSHVFAPIRPDRPPDLERPKLVPRRRCSSTTVTANNSPQDNSPRTPQGFSVPSPTQAGFHPGLSASAAMDERNIVVMRNPYAMPQYQNREYPLNPRVLHLYDTQPPPAPPTTPNSDYDHQLSIQIPENSGLQPVLDYHYVNYSKKPKLEHESGTQEPTLQRLMSNQAAGRGWAPTPHFFPQMTWPNVDDDPTNSSPRCISNGNISSRSSSESSNEALPSPTDYLMQDFQRNQIINQILRAGPQLPQSQLSPHAPTSTQGFGSVTGYAPANNQVHSSSPGTSGQTNNRPFSSVSSPRHYIPLQHQLIHDEALKRGTWGRGRTHGILSGVSGYKQIVENVLTPPINNPMNASVHQQLATAPNNGVVNSFAGLNEHLLMETRRVQSTTYATVATNTSPPPSSPRPCRPATVSVATNTEENPTGTIMIANPESTITSMMHTGQNRVAEIPSAPGSVVPATTALTAALAAPGTSSRVSSSFNGAAPIAQLELLVAANSMKPTPHNKNGKKEKDIPKIPKTKGEKMGKKKKEKSAQESTTPGQTSNPMGDQENESTGASTGVPTEPEGVINGVAGVNQNRHAQATRIPRKDDGEHTRED